MGHGLTQGTLPVSLLAIPLLAMATPEITLWRVHPASVLLFVCYGFGLHLLARVEDRPTWSPVATQHTQDEAEQAQATGRDERATGTLWCVFLVYAAIPRSPATSWARRHPPWSS